MDDDGKFWDEFDPDVERALARVMPLIRAARQRGELDAVDSNDPAAIAESIISFIRGMN